ncbi:DUF499 domain-containing protein [Draconibacterium sp. IB214405]|uniref:DUF499 domain-containing protein n=1 Tax=Draconibacterium sp. IB214405 TaxID=3097352 RepID=UPI002A0C5A1D|nr:DUF499 domain-containing protein [Draconibacterium sp. IB214405]MDX8340543.1 DUF499 domain-containing protein [Draconibacterium sp. IB214405]
MVNINKPQNRELQDAGELFIKGFRIYLVEKMIAKIGQDWGIVYKDDLLPQHQKIWDEGLMAGKDPVELIDWGHLKHFSIHNKDYFKDDFGRNTNRLPTWLEEIVEVRNDWAHTHDIDQDDAIRMLGNMIRILNYIKMDSIAEQLKKIRLGFYPENVKVVEVEKPSTTKKIDTPSAQLSGNVTPWFMNVRPHEDIERGHLDESLFAANLGDVAMGKGRDIYQDPERFFEKTYFTSGLKNLARQVINGLNGNEEAENRVISLQTGFGGGKTHSLISLFHLIKEGKGIADWEFTNEIIGEIGVPKFENAKVAVFTESTNDPTQGRYVDGIHIQTIWGELAWQLGGKEAYEIVRPNDENRTCPLGSLFKKVLEISSPSLILVDELAHYCVAASGVAVGQTTLADQTIGFVQELTQSVSSTNNCVAVVTLPASPLEVASSEKGAEVLISLNNRLSRVGQDTKPVEGDEIFEVIRRRLFEDLGDRTEIDKVIQHYHEYYKTLDFNHEIPKHAARGTYKERIEKAYPFHPELIDVFEKRWASHSDFQRTRGVLRMLGSIVADLWKRQGTLGGVQGLIHTSDLNLGNLDAITSQMKKLWGNGFDAVIRADVSGTNSNSFKIDNNKQEYKKFSISQGVASTILMNTFGGEGANRGVGIQDLKLMVLKPDSYNHNSVNGAIDMLEAEAHYLHYSDVGGNRRYWFETEPNLNILVNQAKGDINLNEIEAEIINRITNRSRGFQLYTPLINPTDDLPEQKRLTLVVAHPSLLVNADVVNGKLKPYIEKLANKRGNNERIYRNTLLFLVPTEVGMSQLHTELRELMACNKIRSEYNSQLNQAQKGELKEKVGELNRKIEKSISVAYSLIIKAGTKGTIEKIKIAQFRDTLDVQFNSNIIQQLKDEEWLIDGVGFGILKTHGLIPTVETPVKVKEVYEAFLRYNDKPMISSIDALQTSLLRFCNGNQLAIAQGEKGNWTKIYLGQSPFGFDVTSDDFWLVDKSLYQEAKPEEPAKPKPSPYPTPNDPGSGHDPAPTDKVYKSITISGKVDVANYSQVFTSFIAPLMNNNVEVTVTVKGKSTAAIPLSESSTQFKITKESASQLGLDFDVEE